MAADLVIVQETHRVGEHACLTQEDWAPAAKWRLQHDAAQLTGRAVSSGGLFTATQIWKGLAKYPNLSTRYDLA